MRNFRGVKKNKQMQSQKPTGEGVVISLKNGEGGWYFSVSQLEEIPYMAIAQVNRLLD